MNSAIGCLIWILFFYYLFLLSEGKIGSLFWSLYLPAGLISLIIGGFKFKSYIDHKHYLKVQRTTQCKHGIKGGETLDLCPKCIDEKEEIKRDEELILVQEKFLADLKIKAMELKREEMKKIAEFKLKNKDYLMDMSPRDFEDVIAELYKKLGYSVTQTPYTNDRGKDAIVIKDNKKYLIECKHFAKGKSIGRPHLQKFLAAIMEEKAEKGFFITTSHFSKTAIDYAEKFNIECIDMTSLIELIIKAYGNERDIEVKSMCGVCGQILTFSYSNLEEKKKCSKGHIVFLDSDFVKVPAKYLGDMKICEKCGKKMKLIKGRYGLFWGCVDYPKCKNTNQFNKYMN